MQGWNRAAIGLIWLAATGDLSIAVAADPPVVAAPLAPFVARVDAEARRVQIGKGGGNPQSESAVQGALAWIIQVQDPVSGSWSLTGKDAGKYSDGAARENRPAATALALLALAGSGESHQQGKFQAQIAKGLAFLRKEQAATGRIGATRQIDFFYTHALATAALCELYGLTQDAQLKPAAEKAAGFLVDSQHLILGGWRYHLDKAERSTDADLAVTGWAIGGLRAAEAAGLTVPNVTKERCSEFLLKVESEGGYGYQAGGTPSESLTAAGICSRQWLIPATPAAPKAVEHVMQRLPTWQDRNVFGWHFGTQALHFEGGKSWTTWNGVLRDQLVAKQEQMGLEKGSWSATQGAAPDRWGPDGGRLYVTALSALMLEVYYRYPARAVK